MNEADTLAALVTTGAMTKESFEKLVDAFHEAFVSMDDLFKALMQLLKSITEEDMMDKVATAVQQGIVKAALRSLLLSRFKASIGQACAEIEIARILCLNRHANRRGVRWSVAATGE